MLSKFWNESCSSNWPSTMHELAMASDERLRAERNVEALDLAAVGGVDAYARSPHLPPISALCVASSR